MSWKNSSTSLWENEEEEPEETHQDHLEEEAHQEEEVLLKPVQQQHSQSPQLPTLKPWVKTHLYSKVTERKQKCS